MNKAQYVLEMASLMDESKKKSSREKSDSAALRGSGDPYGVGSTYGKYSTKWDVQGRRREGGKPEPPIREYEKERKRREEYERKHGGKSYGSDYDYMPYNYTEKEKEFMSKHGPNRKKKLSAKELKRRRRGY